MALKRKTKIRKKSALSLPETRQIMTASELMNDLNMKVRGQRDVKEAVAVAIQRQFHRMNGGKKPKLNTLIRGRTGTGKTHTIQCACEASGIPYYQFPLTGKSEAGLVGENLVDIFQQIPAEDTHAAVHLDELDKLVRVYGSAQDVQVELIPWLSGAQVYDRRTHDMVFFLTGSFDGLEEIAEARQMGGIGFHRQPEVDTRITEEDLIEFGVHEQLIGRIAQIEATEPLTRLDYVKIMGNPYGEFARTFRAAKGTKERAVKMTEAAKNAVIDYCEESSFGARSLEKAAAKLFRSYELGRGPDLIRRGYVRDVLGME
ncbi:MAG: AAA family ATPase [Candidatus Woesearchaeota archaeon]|nr:AAA family ATPase [Candidatus Woesearchaeota archaeon]MDP7182011.1 AAA family ATPase [Candidatus Woesearchaeota archaeon]MDP7198937.1 AAA family ATPase [Candidatus Woesearchaeota archaeon]MDP7467315.1 AAA family ATPase [Candidatus Woesearchaeota archaeon]MDP7646630.1 AAA family ATPase [Candidatus Woesearchaeota archaeon]